jgi:nitronate monooxygenase
MVPASPIAYDAGKALNAAARAAGEPGFGAQWASQGAPLSLSMPAATLVAVLRAEMQKANETPARTLALAETARSH